MLILILALQLPVQHFASVDRLGADPQRQQHLAIPCGIAANAPARQLLAQEAAAGEAARTTAHPTVAQWRTLGCLRGMLDAARVPSREGFLMPAGESWSSAALVVLRKALALAPGDARSADAAGLLVAMQGDVDHREELAAAFVAAFRAGVRGVATLEACENLSMRGGHPDDAERCAHAGLERGVDSTSHLLLLSRLRFRVADTAGGNALFLRAVAAARDTLARNDVAWHLQWFLWPGERKAWDSVAPASRAGWLDDRLRSRDIRDGQPQGARLAEHFARLEYVEANYRMRVPRILQEQLKSGGTSRDSAKFAVDMPSSGSDDFGIGANRAYRRWQTDFDDRGVIYMRFGEPRKRVALFDSGAQATAGGNTRMIRPEEHESWVYEIDGRKMILTFTHENFSGSAAASRLITGYIGVIDCLGIDDWRCGMSMGTLNAANAEKVYNDDLDYVSAGTTSDDNSPRVAHNIGVISRLHRLWDPISDAPIALVTYAVPVADLAIDNGPPKCADLSLELRSWDASTQSWRDTTFARQIDVPDGKKAKLHLTGFLLVPSTPGVSSWSLVAKQEGGRQGRAFDVTSPALGTGPVAMSDLVLGQEGQGIVWKMHNASILLDPLNAIDHKAPVTLYYQVRTDRARGDLHTAISLFPFNGLFRSDSAALQVGFSQAFHAGLNELQPDLDASQLKPGDYVLSIRLIDAEGKVVATREVKVSIT